MDKSIFENYANFVLKICIDFIHFDFLNKCMIHITIKSNPIRNEYVVNLIHLLVYPDRFLIFMDNVETRNRIQTRILNKEEGFSLYPYALKYLKILSKISTVYMLEMGLLQGEPHIAISKYHEIKENNERFFNENFLKDGEFIVKVCDYDTNVGRVACYTNIETDSF